MKNNHFGITRMKRWTMIPAVFLLIISLTAGCASSSSKTVKSETMTSPTSQTTVVERETTTHTDSGHGGLLGGVFHVVGEVLAFPFEVIAGLFRFIF